MHLMTCPTHQKSGKETLVVSRGVWIVVTHCEQPGCSITTELQSAVIGWLLILRVLILRTRRRVQRTRRGLVMGAVLSAFLAAHSSRLLQGGLSFFLANW